MLLIENKVKCKTLHKDLTSSDPWGYVSNGCLAGKLVITEDLSTDCVNVSVYSFKVSSLIDEFIDSRINLHAKKITDKKHIKEARLVIADLKEMILTIERAIN